MNQDHSMDGVDEDNPENQKQAAKYHLSRRDWQACKDLRNDLKDLERMSEADKQRYSGGA